MEAGQHDDFFVAGRSYEVEARDEQGRATDARDRGIARLLRRQLLQPSMALATAILLGAAAVPNAVQAGEPGALPASERQLAVQSVDAKLLATSLKKLTLTSHAPPPLSSRGAASHVTDVPSATSYFTDDGKVICHISMHGFESMLPQMLPAPALSPALSDPQRTQAMRQFTLLHEMAHCEDDLASVQSASSSPLAEVVAAGTALAAEVDRQWSSEGLEGTVAESLRERYADAKALLVMAARELEQVEPPASMRDRLALAAAQSRFDQVARDVQDFRERTREEASEAHDTAAVIAAVRQMVLTLAAHPMHLPVLTAILRDPMQLATVAYRLALGSVVSDLEAIERAAIRQTLAMRLGQLQESASRISALTKQQQLSKASGRQDDHLDHELKREIYWHGILAEAAQEMRDADSVGNHRVRWAKDEGLKHYAMDAQATWDQLRSLALQVAPSSPAQDMPPALQRALSGPWELPASGRSELSASRQR